MKLKAIKYILPAILLFTLIIVSGVPAVIISFILFLLIYIQFPGLMVLAEVSDNRTICAEILLHSFFIGMGLAILEYFLFSIIGLRIVFLVFSPALSIILMILRIRKNSNAGLSPISFDIDIQFVGLFIITCLLSYATQSYCWGNIENYAAFYLYQDIPWHIGNVAMLGQGLPFSDFRISGISFYYHYFNDLVFGMCKYCFNPDASTLLLKCTPLLTSYTFSLGIYSFLKNQSRRVLLSYIVFLTSGAAIPYYIMNSEERHSLLNYHIFSNINGVAVSLAALISVFLYFLKMHNKKKIQGVDLLLFATLIFVMTGLKGPFAVVFVTAMILTCALKGLEEHSWKKMIGISAVMGSTFFLTYYLIIKGYNSIGKASNNNRATNLSITDTFAKTRIWNFFDSLLEQSDLPHTIVYCLCVIIIGGVIASGIYFLIFTGETLAVLYRLIRKRVLPDPSTMVSVCAGWIGLCGFWLVSHTGFSQIYFLFVAILFIVGESLRVLSSLKQSAVRNVLLIVVLLNTVLNGKMYIDAVSSNIKDDSQHFTAAVTEIDEPYMLTHDELEALEWIRENTDSKAIIATDRLDLWSRDYPEYDDDCRCFYYSAFSERQMFIEGFSYSDVSPEKVRENLDINRRIYDRDSLTSGNAIKDSGVDYIIVTKRFNTAPDHFGKPVFSNNDISIYKA